MTDHPAQETSWKVEIMFFHFNLKTSLITNETNISQSNFLYGNRKIHKLNMPSINDCPMPKLSLWVFLFSPAFVSQFLQFKLFEFSFEQHILYLCLPRIMTFLNAQKFYCNFLEVSKWCAGLYQSSWLVLPVSDCEFLIFISYSA